MSVLTPPGCSSKSGELSRAGFPHTVLLRKGDGLRADPIIRRGSVHIVEAFSRNGMRFTVLDNGPVDAETVVLLHGFPQTAQ